MDNNPGGLGGLGGMPLSADDRKLFLELLSKWHAKQNDPTISDSDLTGFFEKNQRGGVKGLDQFIKSLAGSHFNTPSLSDSSDRYRTPEYDSLTDPDWLNHRPTDSYF